MGKVLSFLLLAGILFASPVSARTIKVGVDAAWPPMEFYDESHRIAGFDIDFMEAVAREAGFDVTFENVAWGEIFDGLTARKYDAVCSSVTITEKRAESVDFSLPYFWDSRIRQALLIRKGSALRNLSELKGRVIGAQADTTGYFAVKSAGTAVAKTYMDIRVAIQDLLDGHIDGVICDDPVASSLLGKNEDWANHLEIGSYAEGEIEYYGVAVKKGNKAVLDLINKGIEAVQAKGIDVRLRKKWMGK